IVGGFKVKNEQTGKMEWNIIPHKNRVIHFNENVLKILAKTFENSTDWEQTKLVRIHSQEIISILEKIGEFKSKVSDFENKITVCWDETNDININIIRNTKYPDFANY